MKSFLLFKQNGEIEEKSTNIKFFDISSFCDISGFCYQTYNNYVKYENYIILHNDTLHSEINKTVFYFTTDRFNGDVALIKIADDNSIKNLKIYDYFKKLTKTFRQVDYINSESDSDPDLTQYGNLLLKEPFEY
jgi:hypothetical protein